MPSTVRHDDPGVSDVNAVEAAIPEASLEVSSFRLNVEAISSCMEVRKEFRREDCDPRPTLLDSNSSFTCWLTRKIIISLIIHEYIVRMDEHRLMLLSNMGFFMLFLLRHLIVGHCLLQKVTVICHVHWDIQGTFVLITLTVHLLCEQKRLRKYRLLLTLLVYNGIPFEARGV